MAFVNFYKRNSEYLPAKPEEGSFYWLKDNSIWFAPSGKIDKGKENGGMIRIDNDLDVDGVMEVVNSLIGDMYSNDRIDEKISEVRLWVEKKKYLVKQDIAGKADTSFVNEKIKEINSKIDSIDIPSLEGLATESWVEGKGYLTEHQSLDEINDRLEEIDKVIGGLGEIEKKLDERIKTEVVGELPTENIKENVIYLVPNGDSDDNARDEYMWVDEKWERIGSIKINLDGYATESWVEGKGYLTEHQDISGKVDISDFYNIVERVRELEESSEIDNEIEDLRNELINAIENSFAELFISKQDELVSGENIKTINGSSILGEGDINLPTKEYVDNKISEHKLKWRVI